MAFEIEQLKEILQKPDKHYPDIDLHKYGIEEPRVKEDASLVGDVKVSETVSELDSRILLD